APIVRARVAAEAARRKLDLEVGTVRPGWFAVCLNDVRVGLKGVEGIDVHVDKVTVELSVFLRPREIAGTGARVTVQGTLADLAEAIRQWRSDEKKDATEKKRTPWRIDGLSITWAEKPGEDPIVDASGISVAKDVTYKVGVEAAKGKQGDTSVELSTLS